MSERSDVLVIGGGVIGVCTAWALAERGIGVRLVERGEICSGASHGNAGWIFPGHSMPIPGPGVIRQSLRWLLDPDSPLRIAPRPSLELLRWLWEFRGACNASAMRESYRLRRELSLAGLAHYAKLDTDFDFGFTQRGLLLAFRSDAALAEARDELELLASLGGSGELLSSEALRGRVPALAANVAGGVYLPHDAHLTPGDFVCGLARAAEARGVVIDTGIEVLELRRSRAGVRVGTTRGEVVADEVVLATGAWSGPLAAQLGIRLPVEGAKGYSIGVQRPDEFGEVPVMLGEARVGVSPMGDLLRFAGTLELAGLDMRVSPRRVAAIRQAVREFLPGLPKTKTVEIWRGLRPLTPDDLPLIGRPTRTRGLVVATGHGMKGISQGPVTGELVAQLLNGEPTELDLAPFSPDRFK